MEIVNVEVEIQKLEKFLDSGSHHEVIVRTGERGAVNLQKHIEDNVSDKYEPILDSIKESYDTKNFAMVYKRGRTYVCIMLDPNMDSYIRNKIVHPDGGLNESYRYRIFQEMQFN